MSGGDGLAPRSLTLYGSLTSPFVRKVRIALAEKGIEHSFVRENPRLPGSNAQRLNPLGKVPVLEIDEGFVLYDSPVIIEYLDSLGSRPLLPSAPAARWTALRLQALADGLLESIIRVWLEERRPEEERRRDFLDWENRRIDRALEALAGEPRSGEYFGSELSVADIAVGVALEYLDLRLSPSRLQRFPPLAAWLAPLSRRDSFVQTVFADAP